jgi:hypothetical protein
LRHPGWVAEFFGTSCNSVATRPGRYNQEKSMAGRYRTGVYIRNLSVPSPHSASTLGSDHTFRHIEKKNSNEIRGRTDC